MTGPALTPCPECDGAGLVACQCDDCRAAMIEACAHSGFLTCGTCHGDGFAAPADAPDPERITDMTGQSAATIAPALDPARRLHIKAMIALIDAAFRCAETSYRAAARNLLAEVTAAGIAVIHDTPDHKAAIRIYGISGISGHGPAALLRDWQAEALTVLAREVRP